MNDDDLNIDIQKKKVCIINGLECPVLKEFTVVHIGWELDNEGYIVEYQGENRVVLSSHGSFYMEENSVRNYWMTEDSEEPIALPNDKCVLLDKLNSLKKYTRQLEEAIDLLD